MMMKKTTSTLAVLAMVAAAAACGRDDSVDVYQDPAFEEPAVVAPAESYEATPIEQDPYATTGEFETLPEDTIPVEQPAEPLDEQG
jgi:ABC-type glycerol-3-phosphate transport system substrate-binding protein